MANHANSKLQLIVECLFLLLDEDNSKTMTSSLLLFCVKDALAIMMAPLANFSLQLIVETSSLLLLRDFERPSTTAVMNDSFSFKFIVASHSEGAQFSPNFDQPSDLDSSKLTVIFFEISFHFCEDYRIFHEGEYQIKNDGYAIDKQQSANIRMSSVDRNGLVDRNDLDNHNGLVKHDGKINPNGPASKLIVICNWTKISLLTREDCTIFCEGEWSPTTTKMHGDFTYLFNILLFKLSELIVKYPIGLIVRIIGLVGHNGLVGRIVQNGLVGNNLVNQNGLVDHNDLVDHNGFVGRNDNVDHIGHDLFSHNGLNGFINLGVSFIGLGFVGFIGLCLVSIAGLISHISLVGLGGFSGISSLVGRISLVSLIGLIGLVGLISLGKLGITSLVGSSASSARRLISLVGFTICSLATIAASAILSVAVASQSAEATILIASRVFAREKEDVLVARSRQEKVVAVDCLFW
jgi:hypothetical protein